jgi:hypothetical protein
MHLFRRTPHVKLEQQIFGCVCGVSIMRTVDEHGSACEAA